MPQNRKYRDLSKNTLLFTISSLGSKLIAFLLVPLYTHALTTNDYGQVDIVTTTVQLLIPLLTLNVQDAVLRFSLDKEYDSQTVISNGLKITGISSSALSIVLFFVNRFSILSLDSKYLWFLLLSYIAGALTNCFSMYLKAMDRVKVITVYGIANALITCSLNILFLLVLKWGINGYLIANIAGALVSVFGMFVHGAIYKEIKSSKSNVLLKEMVAYSLPLVANSIAWWLNNASDRYIVTYFCGAAINGVYAVSYKIPTILSTIQNVFYNAWSISAISEYDKKDEDGFIGNTYSLYSCISVLTCSLVLLLNYSLAKLLYLNDFFEAWRFVPFLLVGTVFNGLALFEGCLFTAEKNTKAVLNTTLIGAAINTVLNFLLIPFIGAMGASIATMLGYIAIWFSRTVSVQRFVQMKVNWTTHGLAYLIIIIQSIIALNNNFVCVQLLFVISLLIVLRKYLRNVFNIIKSRG